MTAEMARGLLAVIPQRPVRSWERPIRHSASPEVLTGLDCPIRTGAGARVRGIGTVATQAGLTGGRLLQCSTRTVLTGSVTGRRMAWSHYLARPARVELLGRAGADDLIAGFLHGRPAGEPFDLGGVSARWMGWVQSRPGLDRRAPFPAARTRLRWAATVAADGEPGRIEFGVQGQERRTVLIRAPRELAARLPALCQDLALHDWLLSVLIAAVDLAGIGRRDRAEVVRRLGPPIDHLLHLWMPAARLDGELAGYWTELERRGGFGRQWRTLVRQVRDQAVLGAIAPGGARS